MNIPSHPRIQHLGFVSETKKQTLIKHSACIVNPSPLESLSMIVIEGMMLKRPVLVNKECPVLNDYVEAAQSVKGYLNQEEFNKSLTDILQTDWTTKEQESQLTAAKAWAEKHYSWQEVLATYKSVV